MAKTNFENLRVYRCSEELGDHIWKIVFKWDNFAKDTIGKQLVRSADSIGANIAEGEGRGSYQDNRRFIKIARLAPGDATLAASSLPTRTLRRPGYRELKAAYRKTRTDT